MKFFLTRILCFLFCFVCIISLSIYSAHAAEPLALPSLAVLVHAEPGGEALAEPLGTLLEVEVSKLYDGTMLERAELATVLQEMELSSLLGAAENVQKGKVDGAACLLLARVSPKSVRVTATGFPKTDLIFEREYSERLEAESLSERIAGDVLTGIRSRSRDTKSPYVAIGSFYVLDPHRRFLDFSRTAEVELRKQLAESGDVRLVERMFPSDLLNEFNLARAGMTVSKATDFNAPPADVLLYGECAPRANQNLNNPGILLDCTVKVISPTNLFPPRAAQVTCRSNEIALLIERAKASLLESVAVARVKLAEPEVRSFSMQEFEAFKQQAFRLMPTPPMESGIFYQKGSYRGYGQTGKKEELERALRMLECASLFTGNDTTVLTCTAAVLGELAKKYHSPSEAVQKALAAAATELTERAYRIESTPNTRGFYTGFGFSDHRTEVRLATARQVWNTRETEDWWPSWVDQSFSIFVELEPNFDKRQQLILAAAPTYEKRERGLTTLMSVVGKAIQPIYTAKGDEQAFVLAQLDALSKVLIGSDSLFLQATGHLVGVSLAAKRHEIQPDVRYVNDFLKHFRAGLELTPKLYDLHHKEFNQSNFAGSLGNFATNFEKVFKSHGMQDEWVKIQDEYIVTQMQTGNYSGGGIAIIMRLLVPALKARKQEAHAAELLQEFLKHYVVGGSGDYSRMEFVRMLNDLSASNEKSKVLRLHELAAVPFSDGKIGDVSRLAVGKNGVFGVRQFGDYYSGGKAFRIPLQSKQADIIDGPAAVHAVAYAGEKVAIGTWKNGLFILDSNTMEVRQLTSKNSALPGDTVSLVTDDKDDFLIGIPDKDNLWTHFYRLEPGGGQITATEAKFSIHNYWRIKAGPAKTPVIPQTWNTRTAMMEGKELTLSVSARNEAIKDVTVKREDGETVMTYKGYELTYVYDFMVWQGHLVFVTGNGLYVSKPGSNKLRCILSELDLLLLTSCIVDDKMVLGTSKGVYILSAEQFATAVAP